jgi:23S rRNA (cytosine1962-C5)-methyltransferase
MMAPMEAPMDDHELIDVGDGRRLERFGDRVLVRPHPEAIGVPAHPNAWTAADLVFERGTGWHGPAPETPWHVHMSGLAIELRPTATGQVGLFPEQAESWRWLRERVEEHDAPDVLNLFGYTGVATLVLATAGARVVHVDSSRPAVAWARRNADLSGLAGHPTRWIVDDALAFVAREQRRGRRYTGIVLDPPTYGHGPVNRAWHLDTHLADLLAACVAIVDRDDGFVLLTAHTPGYGPDRLADEVAAALGVDGDRIESGELALDARSGRRLTLGGFARWSARA